MYICPTCQKSFSLEKDIQKHFLVCWKREHPFHVSKEAPHLSTITNSQANDDVLNFFKALKEKK